MICNDTRQEIFHNISDEALVSSLSVLCTPDFLAGFEKIYAESTVEIVKSLVQIIDSRKTSIERRNLGSVAGSDQIDCATAYHWKAALDLISGTLYRARPRPPLVIRALWFCGVPLFLKRWQFPPLS